MARYRKCFPSGRANGQRCDVWRKESILVISTGVPPLALTRRMGEFGDAENRIFPSGPQAPPRPSWASQTMTGAPPLSSIVFNFPSAKNPSEPPLGDQKGKNAS